jgi:RNA-directed DNA polymerase
MLDKLITIKEIAQYLNSGVSVLKNLRPEEHYLIFEIPKPGTDKKRTIEAPKGILAGILDRLSDGLQWTYSDHRTHCAHGYIRSTKNDPDKRTIFTNASRHLGKKYLLNIDLDSFFHQISEEKIRNIFSDSRFFRFDLPAVELLTKLAGFGGRLPMGSPTSPPLSNFATYDLDLELMLWVKHQKITFTRFVDDLSFSSNKPLTDSHYRIIEEILRSHRFSPDPEKIKWFGPEDVKMVTGLITGNKIDLPADYVNDLEQEILRLKEVKREAMLYPDYQALAWVQKLERIVAGRLSFVKTVYGQEHPVYLSLFRKLLQTETQEILSISWQYAGYEYYAL